MICEKCAPRELEAMRALESLTPSGSEFVNDVKMCVALIREREASQHRMIVKLVKENRELRDQVSRHAFPETGPAGTGEMGQ